MTEENPTGESGASISERIESFLAAPTEESQPNEAAEHKEEIPHLSDQAVETPEETEVETPAKDAQTGSDEPQVSLTDVAQYLGVDETLLDVSDDGEILVKTKIDGVEGSAKFDDLVKSYQLQGHVDKKVREVADQAKAQAERVQQFEAYAQQEVQRISTLANIAHQELVGEFGGIDWQQLAQTDPAQYVALQAQVQARQARVKQLLDAADSQNQQAQQARQARFQESLSKAAERIAAEVPGWQAGNEVDIGISNFAHENGFANTAEILAEYPQAAKILWEAQQYRAGKAKSSVVEQVVRKAPKLVKPGQSTDAKQRAQETTRGLKENIRKSGGKHGIAEYLLATGKV